jgi:hypothetical protein
MEAPCPIFIPLPSDARGDSVSTLIEQVTRVLRVARGLAEAGRKMDVKGLDELVGLLCAQCLDLPGEVGRSFRPRLAMLLAEIDALSHCLAAEPHRTNSSIPGDR